MLIVPFQGHVTLIFSNFEWFGANTSKPLYMYEYHTGKPVSGPKCIIYYGIILYRGKTAI